MSGISDRPSRQPQPAHDDRDEEIELLNARWHRLSGVSADGCCAGCLEPLGLHEHQIHQAGAVFHPRCAPNEAPR
ncbi:MAG: hypothetical protein ACREX8_14135, partial [Gammaproteobacteria bacterium]